LFIVTAIVAVGCLVGPPFVREVRARFFPPPPQTQGFGLTPRRIVIREEDESLLGVPKLPPDYRDFRADEVGLACWPIDDAPLQASPPTE
jgi:hypothetical protein